jgi:hypothetical protein
MKTIDQGHLHPKLEVPGLTYPGRESNSAFTVRSKRWFLIVSYTNTVRMTIYERKKKNNKKIMKKLKIKSKCYHFLCEINLISGQGFAPYLNLLLRSDKVRHTATYRNILFIFHV